MNTRPDKPGKAEDPSFWVTRKGARVVLIALHIAAAAAVLIEMTLPFPQAAHAVERIAALEFAGSYAIYGFIACVVLVLLGRLLRRLVMRNEDYYRGGQ